jgi:single-stranded DNA-binding protein
MVSSLNVIHLIGNLTRDPDLRYSGGGRAICTFELATNRSWKTASGEMREESSYHRIVVWEKLAEQCAQLLVKGRVSGQADPESRRRPVLEHAARCWGSALNSRHRWWLAAIHAQQYVWWAGIHSLPVAVRKLRRAFRWYTPGPPDQLQGRKAYVQGRLAYRTYQRDDEEREVAEIMIEDNMLFLDAKHLSASPRSHPSDAPESSAPGRAADQQARMVDPEQNAQMPGPHVELCWIDEEIADAIPF